MINRSPEDVMAAAEALHGESDNIPFLESLLNDLRTSGVQGEAYTDALDLAGLVPSPLELFSILLEWPDSPPMAWLGQCKMVQSHS